MNKTPQAVMRKVLCHRHCSRTAATFFLPVRLWTPPTTYNKPKNQVPARPFDQRNFHSSLVVEFPIRRRRRPVKQEHNDGDGDEPSKSPLMHVPIDDDVVFVQAASALLDKLEKALEPMKQKNDFFVVERFFGEMGEVMTIDLGPKEGKYRIEMSMEDHLFEYSSPISGKVLYVLSAQTGEWVGSQDGHLFEGLLVRDLIRQCQGLPNL